MRQGNITVRNQYHSLRRAYSYFRKGAEIAYAGDGRLAKSRPEGGGSWFLPEKHEAWWNIFGMVMAYFSLLEHVLVGCLPFVDFKPEKESVMGFIGSKWGEKFKRFFDLSADAEASLRYNALYSISEAYRNTYGHGGFDKSGSTVAFHIPVLERSRRPLVTSEIARSSILLPPPRKTSSQSARPLTTWTIGWPPVR